MMSPELTRLLAAERASRPAAGTMERGLPRLLSEMSAELAQAPVAAAATSQLLGGVGKWVLLGFAVGVGASGVATFSFSSAPPVVAVGVTREASTNAVTTPTPRSEPAPRVAAPASLTPPLASLTAPRTAPGVRDASSSAPATFDAELRLIELAKSDLDAGRLEAALGWIDEHERHFRGGVFAPERDALRVRARCARSPDPGLARAFAARRPGSPLAARLFRECEPKTGAIDK